MVWLPCILVPRMDWLPCLYSSDGLVTLYICSSDVLATLCLCASNGLVTFCLCSSDFLVTLYPCSSDVLVTLCLFCSADILVTLYLCSSDVLVTLCLCFSDGLVTVPSTCCQPCRDNRRGSGCVRCRIPLRHDEHRHTDGSEVSGQTKPIRDTDTSRRVLAMPLSAVQVLPARYVSRHSYCVGVRVS